MAGKIPGEFIDELVARVDIVDVIDRRVPLTRKGKEFQACCPFHEEKTASFTVSPVKQFYHCFGCGAHGTAIGFLMEYANLSFVEAIEELADGVGLQVPRQNQPHQADTPGENTGDLLRAVEQANFWFQQQLRKHPDAKQAV
jgi:DNA primase